MTPGSPRDHLWIVIALLGGAASAFSITGGYSDREQRLRNQLSELTSLSEDRQRDIRESYQAFSSLPKLEQQILRELHAAVAADADVNRRLSEFRAWYDSLHAADKFETDALLRSQDARAISSRMNEHRLLQSRIVVQLPLFGFRRFTTERARVLHGRPLDGAEFLPSLNLSRSEFRTVLDKVLPDSRLTSSERDDLAQLNVPDEKCLFKSFLLLERFASEQVNRNEEVRHFFEVLSKEVPDAAWRQRADEVRHSLNGENSHGSNITRIQTTGAMLTILDQAVIDLSRELQKEFAPTDAELIATLDEHSDSPEGRDLLRLTPESAVDRLRTMATEQQIPAGPADRDADSRKSLYRRRMLYENQIRKLSASLIRNFSFGDRRGPPANGRRNGGERNSP